MIEIEIETDTHIHRIVYTSRPKRVDDPLDELLLGVDRVHSWTIPPMLDEHPLCFSYGDLKKRMTDLGWTYHRALRINDRVRPGYSR